MERRKVRFQDIDKNLRGLSKELDHLILELEIAEYAEAKRLAAGSVEEEERQMREYFLRAWGIDIEAYLEKLFRETDEG